RGGRPVHDGGQGDDQQATEQARRAGLDRDHPPGRLPHRGVSVRIPDRLVRSSLRAPPRTVRLRLPGLYATLFLASGVGLLAVTYLLVREATGNVVIGTGPNGNSVIVGKGAEAERTANGKVPLVLQSKGAPGGPASARQLRAQAAHDRAVAVRQRDAALHQLV